MNNMMKSLNGEIPGEGVLPYLSLLKIKFSEWELAPSIKGLLRHLRAQSLRLSG
ncbi:hypothetical protein MYP_2237 [Sporocytophaga myxococcoides]|uniref:Uncharacterized protein n=1 Tax=Sporocytophaga myxococcoides TaxID=153721 RepID=A0A098LEZ8_9BACT|nr:hypothetical protein MYP_2237 [Sporocytophaga myxococcoides]